MCIRDRDRADVVRLRRRGGHHALAEVRQVRRLVRQRVGLLEPRRRPHVPHGRRRRQGRRLDFVWAPPPLRHASPLALPGVTVGEREIDLLIAAMASRGAAAESARRARRRTSLHPPGALATAPISRSNRRVRHDIVVGGRREAGCKTQRRAGHRAASSIGPQLRSKHKHRRALWAATTQGQPKKAAPHAAQTSTTRKDTTTKCLSLIHISEPTRPY